MSPKPPPDSMRLDKWLWAARFFKTRSLAGIAIDGGKVHVNGSRAKPAKEIQIGDRLEITTAEVRWEVCVLALSDRRGPAPEARLLYAETPESARARESARDLKRFSNEPAATIQGRPTKRDRRQLGRFNNS